MTYAAPTNRSPRSLLSSAAMVASMLRERAIPFRSRARIAQRRDHRVREVVRLAWETDPFYRAHLERGGVAPEQIRGADDLHLIPPISHVELRADPEAFLSNRFRPRECHHISTSGRSGRPKLVYHDPQSLLMNVSWSERHEQVLGHFTHRRIGRRLLTMNVEASVASHVHAYYRRRLRLLRRLGPRREWINVSAPFEQQVELLNRFQPELIISYGTFMGDFFAQIHRRGLHVHRPELISLGGEGILPEHRRLIEEDFGIPIVMTYQSGESLKIGFECEERRYYHLHEDLCHVRALDEDGREVPDGEVGRVHITNLVNRATVLINYDLGGLGRLLPVERCPCGRNLRRLELVEGRRWPMLHTFDGRALHFVDAIEPLQREGWIDRAQVVVERPDLWRILFISTEGDRVPDWREQARARVAAVAGPGIAIELEPVERLELTDTGKFTPVLVRCPGHPPYV